MKPNKSILNSVDSAWECYVDTVLKGIGRDTVQFRETKKAFYGGYYCALKTCKALAELDMDEGVEVLESLYQECLKYAETEGGR